MSIFNRSFNQRRAGGGLGRMSPPASFKSVGSELKRTFLAKRPAPVKKTTPILAPSKGPYEKRGSVPRNHFQRFFKQGPYSMPYSRNVAPDQRKRMGDKLLKERFPARIYSTEISKSEMQRVKGKLREARSKARTGAERNALTQEITRLEEFQKRAGL